MDPLMCPRKPWGAGVEPAYWIGWFPFTGLVILLYLLVTGRENVDRKRFLIASLLIAILGLTSGFAAWESRDDLAILTAIHLPFVIWMLVGWTVTPVESKPVHFYAFILKSAETVVMGGLYAIAGALFAGLTFGIFSALGVGLPKGLLTGGAAFGIGAIPLLALASVCDPATSLAHQDWARGLARIVRIIPRLILPAALGVLLIYILWFIPTYFWRPFEDRTALAVFNATIMAIIALITTALPGMEEEPSGWDKLLGRSLLLLVLLTFVLNAYALAAVVARIVEHGLTPNRHAVCGWNAVTLAMLLGIARRLWWSGPEPWTPAVRRTIALMMLPAFAWALWVLWMVPLF